MSQELFDRGARRLRFARALKSDEPFLLTRAFHDCLDRLAAIDRPLSHILFVGPAFPAWLDRLRALGPDVALLDPAEQDEDRAAFAPGQFDAVVAVGSLDSVNDLPAALAMLAASLKPDSPLVGALVGGDSFPALRDALIHADRAAGGAASPRSHPRIGAQSLAGLLQSAGLTMPVVDIDRLAVRYSSFPRLVADLRAAALANSLASRPRAFPGRTWAARLADRFTSAAGDGRTTEMVETLHFIGWSRPR